MDTIRQAGWGRSLLLFPGRLLSLWFLSFLFLLRLYRVGQPGCIVMGADHHDQVICLAGQLDLFVLRRLLRKGEALALQAHQDIGRCPGPLLTGHGKVLNLRLKTILFQFLDNQVGRPLFLVRIGGPPGVGGGKLAGEAGPLLPVLGNALILLLSSKGAGGQGEAEQDNQSKRRIASAPGPAGPPGSLDIRSGSWHFLSSPESFCLYPCSCNYSIGRPWLTDAKRGLYGMIQA